MNALAELVTPEMKALRTATINACKRTGCDAPMRSKGGRRLGTEVRQGRFRVVLLTHTGKATPTVECMTDWLTVGDATRYLDRQ